MDIDLDFNNLWRQRFNRLLVLRYENDKLRWASPWKENIPGLDLDVSNLERGEMFYSAYYKKDQKRKIIGIEDATITYMKRKNIKRNEPETLLGYRRGGIGDYITEANMDGFYSALENNSDYLKREMNILLMLIQYSREELEKSKMTLEQLEELRQSELIREREQRELYQRELQDKQRRLIKQYAGNSK